MAQRTGTGFLEPPRAVGCQEEGISRKLGKEEASAGFSQAHWDPGLGFICCPILGFLVG